MTEPLLGDVIVAAVAVQRVVELACATSNARRLVERGGVIAPANGMRAFVVFHVAWFVAIALERHLVGATLFATPFAVSIAAALLAVEALRAWVLATLRRRWTIEVVVVPGERPVTRGPYRFVRHPNYTVVVAEVALAPLLVGAWRTALVGSILHVPLLVRRVRREEAAWREIGASSLSTRPRFVAHPG